MSLKIIGDRILVRRDQAKTAELHGANGTLAFPANYRFRTVVAEVMEVGTQVDAEDFVAGDFVLMAPELGLALRHVEHGECRLIDQAQHIVLWKYEKWE